MGQCQFCSLSVVPPWRWTRLTSVGSGKQTTKREEDRRNVTCHASSSPEDGNHERTVSLGKDWASNRWGLQSCAPLPSQIDRVLSATWLWYVCHWIRLTYSPTACNSTALASNNSTFANKLRQSCWWNCAQDRGSQRRTGFEAPWASKGHTGRGYRYCSLTWCLMLVSLASFLFSLLSRYYCDVHWPRLCSLQSWDWKRFPR